MRCFFVSDLHGDVTQYGKLFERVREETPQAVFLGGDLLPSGYRPSAYSDFVGDYLATEFRRLKESLGADYPPVFLILGNDDPRAEERDVLDHDDSRIWDYAHARWHNLEQFSVLGYACVPPSPFLLKDWERYDVSRYVDPGCVSPEHGARSVEVPANEQRYRTIQKDLVALAEGHDLSRCICLFHSPPHATGLDRAALDGRMVDHVPVDPHIGSIAIRRFIEERQPLLTLHGHVHESTRLTGRWREQLGRTHMFNAAHDGPELSLIRFDPEDLGGAERELI